MPFQLQYFQYAHYSKFSSNVITCSAFLSNVFDRAKNSLTAEPILFYRSDVRNPCQQHIEHSERLQSQTHYELIHVRLKELNVAVTIRVL